MIDALLNFALADCFSFVVMSLHIPYYTITQTQHRTTCTLQYSACYSPCPNLFCVVRISANWPVMLTALSFMGCLLLLGCSTRRQHLIQWSQPPVGWCMGGCCGALLTSKSRLLFPLSEGLTCTTQLLPLLQCNGHYELSGGCSASLACI